MTTYVAAPESDALRADGRPIRIRMLRPDDAEALKAFNQTCSDNSLYLRFFAGGRSVADRYVDHLFTTDNPDRRTLVATSAGQVVALAGYEKLSAHEAEIALMVGDAWQHEGIGTLLIEHLASVARHAGIERFVAEVLVHNTWMRRAFRDLGYHCEEHAEEGVTRISVELTPTAKVQDLIDERDRLAEQASMKPMLAPRSLVVIGASQREHSIGNALLQNVLEGGFTGGVYVVNPKRRMVLGVDSFPDVASLPVVPDLAIVALPAEQVAKAVKDCGKAGVRAVAVVSSGFSEVGGEGAALQRELLETGRQYGMRLLGPNCLGLVNTDPGINLNATFAPLEVSRGGLALASQSGALGIAVLSAAASRGLGIAQFVSMGNKADVSGNDLILAWHADPGVRVIALYLESVGNARKFARICRRVSQDKPIIVIKAGRTDAGRRAGLSHTAAAAASDRVVDALFEQAGVIRVDTIEEMLDAAAVLTDRRRLAGPRIAIVGNSGGPEILAADAAISAGLTIAETKPRKLDALRRVIPNAPSLTNPIDLGAGVQPDVAGAIVHQLIQSNDVDAVLAVFCQTLVASDRDLVAAVAAAANSSRKPVVLCQIGNHDIVEEAGGLPVFTFPEPAAKALGTAWRWNQIRTAPVQLPELPRGVDLDRARIIVTSAIENEVEWLPPDQVADLLDAFGIPRAPQRVVTTAVDAVSAAEGFVFPVVMKGGPAGAHKGALGAVRLDVRTPHEVNQAFHELMAIDGTHDVLVQPTAETGVELIIGAVADAQFGPVVMVGCGGAVAGLTRDEVFRLAPISINDAALALDACPSVVSLLRGWRGMEPVSRLAVADLVVRVGALVDELPGVVELDLNPVICRGRDLVAVDARVRVADAPRRQDPTVRQLRPVV